MSSLIFPFWLRGKAVKDFSLAVFCFLVFEKESFSLFIRSSKLSCNNSIMMFVVP
jgi:hypothetical protein